MDFGGDFGVASGVALGFVLGFVLGFALADGVADSVRSVPGLASSVGVLLAGADEGAADALPAGSALHPAVTATSASTATAADAVPAPRPPRCAWPRPVLLLRIIPAP